MRCNTNEREYEWFGTSITITEQVKFTDSLGEDPLINPYFSSYIKAFEEVYGHKMPKDEDKE